MLARILVEDPIPLRPDSPAVPEPFGSTIHRALARDPDQRLPEHPRDVGSVDSVMF